MEDAAGVVTVQARKVRTAEHTVDAQNLRKLTNKKLEERLVELGITVPAKKHRKKRTLLQLVCWVVFACVGLCGWASVVMG